MKPEKASKQTGNKENKQKGCFASRKKTANSQQHQEQQEEEMKEVYEPCELQNIQLNCEKGQLTAVVGHVGCGKSSLINSILGEMPKKDASVRLDDMVHIKGSIGYVPQTPFIMNATLRENILFGSEYSEELYQVVD